MNAGPMIDTCFRRQHPEAYGRAEVTEPPVPSELRYGRGEYIAMPAAIPEEAMGHPEAVPLP